MEEGTHMGSTPRLGEEDDLAYHDNVEEASIWPASLHPPPLPAAAPPWILLELPAYLTTLGGAAATTARSRTRGGHAIEATLFPAAPPLLSHIRVHCPDLSPTRFAAEPRVYAAADGLILFAVAIGHRFLSSNLRMLDYFLYDLARPSLELLPHPPEPPGLRPHPFSQAGFFGDKLVALLRLCHNDEEQLIMRPHGPVRSDYIIAILVGQEGRAFDLHRYRSDAGAWTRTRLQLAASVNTPLGGTFFSHYTDKVITLTGGFVGWADLRRGAILFLDVLLDDPQPHYVPLPPQPMTGNCDALVAQDIAVVDKGYIKFIDHRYNDDASDHGWTATTWTKKIAADPWKEEEGWRMVCELRASDVLVPNSMLPLLPKPLQRLRTGHPAINLQHDNVVYFMCKDRLRDDDAWMVAIDMAKKKLQGVVPFCAGRTIAIDRSYVQLRLPGDHPKTAPGRMKRPGVFSAGSSSKKLSVSPFQDMYTS